mmetsp:Transcript_12941/g.19606  ORF Transcript_12941/g.19606 Transcript_12941/m.19606 type:complete len:106 (+) Transcript_12941:493-810(+)
MATMKQPPDTSPHSTTRTSSCDCSRPTIVLGSGNDGSDGNDAGGDCTAALSPPTPLPTSTITKSIPSALSSSSIIGLRLHHTDLEESAKHRFVKEEMPSASASKY